MSDRLRVSGKAPSEKHLEEYLWKNPGALNTSSLPTRGPLCEYSFLWRQLRLPSGIADLVGVYLGIALVFVELKVGTIDTKAFAQLMRYKRDFKIMLEAALIEYQESNADLNCFLSINPCKYSWWDRAVLSSALIGHTIESEALLLACDACDTTVITYDFDGEHYHFTKITPDSAPPELRPELADIATKTGIERQFIALIRESCSFRAAIEGYGPFSAIDDATDYVNGLFGGEL